MAGIANETIGLSASLGLDAPATGGTDNLHVVDLVPHFYVGILPCVGCVGFTAYIIFGLVNRGYTADNFEDVFGPDNVNVSYSKGNSSCFFESGPAAGNTTDCCAAYLATTGLGNTGFYGNGYGSNTSVDTVHVINRFLRHDSVCGAAFVDCIGAPELVSVPLGPLASLCASVVTYYLTPKVSRNSRLLLSRVPIAVWIGAWAQLFVLINTVRLYAEGQKVYAGPGGGDWGFNNRCGVSHFFLMPLMAPTAVSIVHIVSVGKRHLYDTLFDELEDRQPADRFDKLNRLVLFAPIVCIVAYIFVF